MGEGQNEVLQEILAEQKAGAEATAKFRTIIQSECADQRTRLLHELEEQRRFRQQSIRLQRGMLLILLVGVSAAIAIFAWAVRRPQLDHHPPAVQLVPIEP